MTATATRLTPSERVVVSELCADGAVNKTLARRMFLTEQTVKFHLTNAMRKAAVSNRTALALWWVRSGQYENADPV